MVLLKLVNGIAGALMLGGSATIHLLTTGRLTGLSGVFSGLLKPRDENFRWKSIYGCSLMLGGLLSAFLVPGGLVWKPLNGKVMSWSAATVGGLLVGFGTRLGNGCTSGHGLCGIPRFAIRSIVATMTFMGAGIVTASMLDLYDNGIFRVAPGAYDSPQAALQFLAASFCLTTIMSHLVFKSEKTSVAHDVSTIASGALFGGGLVVSTMTKQEAILGFLTMTSWETWDATLLVVFLGGVLFNALSFRLVWKMKKEPLTSHTGTEEGPKCYQITTNKNVTFDLIVGSACFGVGWGITGLCPGPAMDLVAIGMPKVWAFTAALFSGFFLQSRM